MTLQAGFLEELKYRGLVNDYSDPEELERLLVTEPVALYCGFDPTADSLHIGHLLPMMTLQRFQMAGHRPIALAGGGTGLIGDPSGKTVERTLNPREVVESWVEKIKNQLSLFLDFDAKTNPALLLNNYDWISQLNVIEYLRDIGKYFSVNAMLAKDSVKTRIENRDVGISYTEFSYMILQSYDYYWLAKHHGCKLQIGGSDQWGNITTGIDLIRRTLQSPAYALTLPLITTSEGKKFGKTEAGAVWLDASKTSPYQFYQFWINITDQDVIKFIKYFTFLDRDTISQLESAVRDRPEKREAQQRLAYEVTSMIHGRSEADMARQTAAALFKGEISSLTEDQLKDALAGVPTTSLDEGRGGEMSLLDLVVEAGLCPSRSRGRTDIESGAIYVNDIREADQGRKVSDLARLHRRYVVLRKGKKNYHLVIIE
ncbi:MAG: tyrosine--tRNA ligase [Actinobacteria bacterium]|nr:tyrosine--tRNA ligase [Actinomycetota bacterium]